MRKIQTTIAVIVILIVTTLTCAQSTRLEITPEKSMLAPGDTTNVVLTWNGGDHIAYSGNITFSDNLTVSEFTTPQSGGTVLTNIKNNSVRWGVISKTGMTGNIAQFKVTTNTTGNYAFNGWALANTDSISVHGGTPIVVRMLGDMDNNAQITMSDVMTIFQYIINGSPIDPIVETFGDIDGNGTVQVYDSALLLQQVQN